MSVPSLSLEGRVAIVTGAGGIRGIGRATALTLAEAGAAVAVCDINVKGETFDLKGTAEEIRKMGRRSLAVQTDVTKAIKLDPNNAWQYSQRASVYTDKGEYDLALADLQQGH